jgi:hypothetical protein
LPRRPAVLQRPPVIVALGFLAGAVAWPLVAAGLPILPPVLRFAVAFALFALGPGLAITGSALHDFDKISRAVLATTIGIAVSPMVAHALGLAGGLHLFPFAATGLLGAAIAALIGRRHGAQAPGARPLAAGAAIVLGVSLVITGMSYANRLTVTPDEIVIHGEYDSFDSTYYAAMGTELAHRIPPAAPFNAGHMLNYAYYPHLFLAMIHRFGDVPLLSIYFGYAWTVLLALAALTLYVLLARVTATWTAAVAAVLFLIGSDLSYLAAWLGPPDTYLWDYVIWSSNTQSPAAETLIFNTFAPAMAVLFAALFAVSVAGENRSRHWLLLAGLLVAAVLQFKPFAYADAMAGLAGAVVFAGAVPAARRRYAVVIVLSLLFTLPFAYAILTHYNESQAKLTIDLFQMPRTTLEKLALDGRFAAGAERLGLTGGLRTAAMALAATPVFLVLGLGYRCLGLRELFRGLRGQHGSFVRLVAWTALAAGTMPFVVATKPYHQTLHFYQVALFLMPVFVAIALGRLGPRARWGAAALTVAMAVPSTAHYVWRKWNDHERPFAMAGRAELNIAAHLSTLDRDSTVLLHDRSEAASMFTILSGRHTVLAWSRYVPNSREKALDVERFFRSADGPADVALATLRKYYVTHVIEAPHHRIHPDVKAGLVVERQEGHLTLYRVRWQARSWPRRGAAGR